MAKKAKEAAEPKEDVSDGTVAVNDAWTGLLAISLLALVIATGFLVYDYLQYDSTDKLQVPKLSSTPPAIDAAKPAPEKKADDKDKDKAKEKDKQ